MMKKLLILLTVLATLALVGCGNKTTGGAVVGDGLVSIPLSDLSSTVQFYTYNDGGVDINYFAVLGSDGNPRTAFDACDVCGGRKGYQQQGSDIACRNCGRVFSIDGLGTKNKGYGCWPSYLPHEIKDGNVVIKISDIKAGKYRFA
jgi:uncharacterized membrane protein